MNKIQKCGLPPGSLIHTGERKVENMAINVLDFTANGFEEKEIKDIEELRNYVGKDSTTWVNIDGLHDTESIEKIGKIFDIHALVLEDILDTDHRPKAEFYDGYAFIVIKMLNYNSQRDIFENEQLSMVMGKNFVLTFQEEPGDVFDTVRARIRKGLKVRQHGPDYLAYTLLDLIVDTYFHMLERMGEWIEDMELNIIRNPNRRRTLEINELKHDLNFLRKNIWPVREVAHVLQRHEEDLITRETQIFLNDLYDHIIQVIETVETYRDMIGNLMDLYLSNISYKMNEVMKTLTVITSLFIPLTFITGLYGMNFTNMPELHTKYGYYVVLGVLALVATGMIMFFRRRGWF
ncbi:MAG: magnesium/cobalt transporter CorA [Sphingobacteriales bacterium]|nr:MAG: magnesium/cobalt transporter CorA [Sphingobacteriales bacterium]